MIKNPNLSDLEIYQSTAINGVLFTTSYAMMPVVLAKDDQEPKLVRPRDLSIYPEESKENKTDKENNWEPTLALGSIQKVREEIVSLNQQWSKVKDRVYAFVQTGISHRIICGRFETRKKFYT